MFQSSLWHCNGASVIIAFGSVTESVVEKTSVDHTSCKGFIKYLFFLTKDTSYPWYHRCISFFQICFPVVTLGFSSSNTPEDSCTYMHLWYWGWKGSEKSKCLCSMSAIIIPSKIAGNSIKYFAFTFLATDMYVIIWPLRLRKQVIFFIFKFLFNIKF